tara:strand:+ start:23309 stop:23944 length:636 start_codon:yes stop_codon:yes gene_type:complete
MATAKNVSNLKVKVVVDSFPASPRDDSGLGTMVCEHSRYDLGDKDGLYEAVNFVEECFSERQLENMGFDRTCLKSVENALVFSGKALVLPLYLYDHSGITMRTTPFSCPWDSSKVGFIFYSFADMRKEFGYLRINHSRKMFVNKQLKSEVEVYSQYLEGDVWGLIVEEDSEVKESVFGFYGGNPLINGMSSYLCEQTLSLVKNGNFERVYS